MALYLANFPKLKQSMLAQQGSSVFVDLQFIDELKAPEDGHCNDEELKLDESIVVKHAYYFFQIFKVFIGDLIFSSEEREISRQYFQKVSAMDALRVISVELQFIYDILYTKALVLHFKLSYFFRFIAFTHIVSAFILFNRLKSDKIHAPDVRITYSLLLGGIALDVISLLRLILSDWTVAEFKLYNKKLSQQYSFLNNLVSAMDHLRKPQFATCTQPNATVTYKVLNTPLIFQRWSESISACNFFSEFLKESPRKMHKQNRSWGILVLCNICCFPIFMAMKIISCFQQAGGGTRVGGGGRGAFMHDRGLMITEMKYVSKNPFINKLWIYIFEEVRRKAKDANDLTKVKEIFDARGGMFLQSIAQEIDCGNLSAFVTGANYDFAILTWHIATEMWYNMEKQNMNSTLRNEEREFSKILSDYMMYLLLNKPSATSVVRGTFEMTVDKASLEMMQNGCNTTNVERLCEKLFHVPTETFNLTSPLGEGMKLAHEMERLREEKWKVMAGVWVEMLSYAAIHIKGNEHVLLLSKGGELLTFVWLLMAHFGCFYKPEWGISRERFHMYRPAR
ncbi:uncharacterized protein LOC104428898 [Eucalyptus grandis]|uniref:uncharacterized protein LOC104428898 n=1 Tax=Eucalyptus grandis TaxID=71139 RepID=UPI00192E82D2|nr:uncharacterized protein LOC104428898 [Eucalyptus grandis]